MSNHPGLVGVVIRLKLSFAILSKMATARSAKTSFVLAPAILSPGVLVDEIFEVGNSHVARRHRNSQGFGLKLTELPKS